MSTNPGIVATAPVVAPEVSHDHSHRLRRQARSRDRGKGLLFHLFVLAVTAVVLYPALWMLMSSFKPTSDIVGNVSLWPEDFNLANYATALNGIGGVSF